MRQTTITPRGRGPLAALTLVALLLAVRPASAQNWPGYGRDPQHSAETAAASQHPGVVRWSTPVDLNPQYNQNSLLIHYGSPLITRSNMVLIPVKTGAFSGFRVDARRGGDGQLLWSLTTDYILPPHNWVPSVGPTLTPRDANVVVPAAGGTVLMRPYPEYGGLDAQRVAFFGNANYAANTAAYNANVAICTPITADALGNLYFGFVLPNGPVGVLTGSGIARISRNGAGSWVTVPDLLPGLGMRRVAYNCAPAVTVNNSTVYVAVTNGAGQGAGYLVALHAANLSLKSRVRLKDVRNPASDAILSDDSTASPTIGPDGDVYYGVLENPFYANHLRGWLLHYSSDLSQTKTASAFGWDDTASIVPKTSVPSYSGTSSYLLLTKYNNYVEGGGDGVNKLAVVDPNDLTMTDPISGATVMKTILTVAGPTPDPEFTDTHPNAVREWCINTAAIDAAGKCALVNCEDGKLYRWDFVTNTLSAGLMLNGPVGEAYTPTLVGPDGAVYAINNATLYSCVAAP